MNFSEWLEKEKGMSHKSSHDAASRLKRASIILGVDDMSGMDVKKLEEKESFRALSITVKSQLRRAVRLYEEFKMDKPKS